MQLNPQDGLSKQLLASMSGQPPPTPPPAAPVGPPIADPNALVGNWSASREDGAQIQLQLAPGGAFEWDIARSGSPPQQITGSISPEDGIVRWCMRLPAVG